MIRICHLRAAAMLAAAFWPLTALADTIHVAPCGDDAWTGTSAICAGPDGPKATIQAAIDAAVNGDVVLVADGTYTGPGNRNMDFGGKAITLRSASGAAASIIDIAASEAAPARAFHFHSGETADSIVEGLTIRSGFMNRGGAVLCEGSSPLFRECIFESNTAALVTVDDGGGAVYNLESSPRFVACRFVRNHAEVPVFPTDGGGGGAVRNELFSDPVFIDCVFEENTLGGQAAAGAIYSQQFCHLELSRCTFRNNRSDFGAGAMLLWRSSTATIRDCHFIENEAGWWAGAAAVLYGSDADFTDCVFSGNVAHANWGGGALNVSVDSARITATNCTFFENRAVWGGGVWALNTGEAVVTNCTFFGNSGPSGGGAIYAERSGQVTVRNSILYGNSPHELGIAPGSTADVTYSNIKGGWPGAGNIDEDPSFLDQLAGDLRLSAGSPCINAGDDSAVPAGITTDLAGLPRFVGVVDMGAYEYQGCYADCDQSGALDFFDFLCFQNLFAAGDPAADCDASAHLDFFDFLCFQNAFAAGCL